MQSVVRAARGDRMVIGLVPTMGALHAGHISLVHRARKECGLIIASLFVNPIQFGANEDFDSYPRDQERDFGIFERNGVDIVYAPAIDVIYPEGFGVTVTVSKLTECLCGTKRPGHFDGVTTVVSKLFEHCQPDCAYFGEKDYQQLKVVEQMVNELDLPIRVVGAPVIRERDGLAMSSRNTYLNETERRIAPALFRTMRTVAIRLSRGAELESQCQWGSDALLAAGFDRIDYFEVCDGQTLERARGYRPSLRIFAAAWLRETRLIDNLAADEID
mgnify:FL=1